MTTILHEATAEQEALRLALIDTLGCATALTHQEHLAVLACVLGQILAIHVREADDPAKPLEMVMKNMDSGRRSMSQ